MTSNYLNRGYKDILSYADDASLLQKLPAVASDDLDTGLLKRALDEWVADAKNHILNTETSLADRLVSTLTVSMSLVTKTSAGSWLLF